MSDKRYSLLEEAMGLVAKMTDEQCKLALAATKIGVVHPELSPEDCLEMARREAVT